MSVNYTPVRVYQENGTYKVEADEQYTARHPVVTGNSLAFGVTLTYEGEGWEGLQRVLRIVAVPMDGEESEYYVSAYDTDNVIFPPISDAVVLFIYVTRGERTTTVPAVLHCTASITDNSGIEDEPEPDIYNLMLEYMAQRRSGSQSRADAILSQLYTLRESAPPAYPGDDYRLTAKRAERVTTVTGKLTLADNTKITVTDDMILSNSLKLAAEAISSDALIPGGVPSTELQVTLRLPDIAPGDLYEARLVLAYHIQRSDEHWCEIALGAFTVTEAKSSETGRVQITGFDDMLKFTRLSRGAIPFTAEAYTVHQVFQMLVTAAGVSLEGGLPEGSYTTDYVKITELNTGIETGRDLLGWIAQLGCCVAMINPKTEKLQLVPISSADPVEEYTEGDSLAHATSNLEYRLYELKTITPTRGLLTDETTGPRAMSDNTLWASGVTADLPENLLLEAMWFFLGTATIHGQRALYGQLIHQITLQLDPVIFTPGEVQIYGDPALRLLEWVKVRTETGNAEFPITRTEWVYRGSHKIESGGMDAVAGTEKTMAEKRTSGARIKTWQTEENGVRAMVLMFVQTEGHYGMVEYTHDQLHHFTHKELGTKGEY